MLNKLLDVAWGAVIMVVVGVSGFILWKVVDMGYPLAVLPMLIGGAIGIWWGLRSNKKKKEV